MMRRNSKFLISIISAVIVCLLLSTATTTIAAGDFGNLETGDEMSWKLDWDPTDPTSPVTYIEVKILDISGTVLTYSYKTTVTYDSTSSTDEGTYSDSSAIIFMLYPQSYLQQMKADAEANADSTYSEANFNWKGGRYKTHYFKYVDSSGDILELWFDRDTGILFEWRFTTGGTAQTWIELQSTTASLTKAGICFGTILISLVSVTTLVAISLVRYQKKKKI